MKQMVSLKNTFLIIVKYAATNASIVHIMLLSTTSLQSQNCFVYKSNFFQWIFDPLQNLKLLPEALVFSSFSVIYHKFFQESSALFISVKRVKCIISSEVESDSSTIYTQSIVVQFHRVFIASFMVTFLIEFQIHQSFLLASPFTNQL